MSKRTTLILLLALSLIVTAGSVGCKKKKADEEIAPPPPVQETTPPPPPKEPVKQEVKNEGFEQAKPDDSIGMLTPADLERITAQLQTVYFGFDKSDLTDDARGKIRANTEILKANPKAKVVVEGHCDERGTIEYNLALGERRAKAVRDYMTSLGVTASRIRIVSYGEEKPAVQGHNESSWAKNRRGEFKAE